MVNQKTRSITYSQQCSLGDYYCGFFIQLAYLTNMKEQIYNDFITKVLPSIQTGLTITKDYFFDLFGRYVKYLLFTDSLCVTSSAIVIIISVIFLYQQWKFVTSTDYDSYDNMDRAIAGWIIPGAFLIFSSVFFVVSVDNLLKTIFIPEVRVYEELSNFRK